MSVLECACERLLGEIEGELGVRALADQRGKQPRDVPVVQRDDRVRFASQASQRVTVGEPAHNS